MSEETNNNNDPHRQTLMGHIRLLPKVIFFAMAAYGFVHLLIWISEALGVNL